MHAVRCGETVLGQVGIAVQIPASKGALQLLIKCFDLGVFHLVSIGRRRALIDRIYGHYDYFTPISKNKAKIGLATLGNDAGIYGAARLILE